MIFLILLLFTVLFYLPIIINPSIFVARGNDLTEFFWPIIYFVKENLLKFRELPFWNNLFFSGTPLLPDPQAPIFYFPNIIFLIFKNLDTGFLVSTYLHILASGIGMYLLGKLGFNFSRKTALFCSLLYITSPKLSGYIESGHFGLINSWAWLPFALLSTILLSRKPNFKKSIFLSISLAGLFYTHILIFAIALISFFVLYLYLRGQIKYLILSGFFCFGFTAMALLPQLSWQNATTRNLLLTSPDVYPKWLGLKEFIKACISPILFGPKFIWGLDTEKTIGFGLFATIFAFYGWVKLKFKQRFFILIPISFIIFISLNNISPFQDLLISQNWFILLRVSTRFWFIEVFIFIFLAGYGFEKLLLGKRSKFLIHMIALLAITEFFLTSWTRLLKPILPDYNLVPQGVYDFLSLDKSQFRVFCLSRCLSQKESAIYGLELAEGYGTLQQTNYYIYSEQLAQAYYRNRYTLSIPPFEIFEYENLQPYSPNLAAMNIKYVISNHILTDKNLKLTKVVGKYIIYENTINLPRANYPIAFYSPNRIQIDTSKYKNNEVTLSEVFNKDWKTFNNTKELTIHETIDKTRVVTIDKNTKQVLFVYEPDSFKVGLAVTSITVILCMVLFPRRKLGYMRFKRINIVLNKSIFRR